ncbi:MAG: hypothetical protein H6673_15935 [Anaerolineales bacterium]|nr:hypothetical protein [Anaerolineales bacterium]
MNILKRLWTRLVYNRGIFQRYIGLRTRNPRNFGAAERAFSRVLHLNERHINARVSRGVLRWRELDNWVGAITDFTELLEQVPTYYLALFYRGMAFYRAGDYYASAQDLAMFIRLDPDSRWAHHARIQLEGMYAILDDLPKLLAPPIEPAASD